MSKQLAAVPVAALEGVEPSVASTRASASQAVPALDRGLIAQLVGDAQRQGLPVDGEGGLLAELTRLVLESALEGEITDHLGYDKHERGGSADGNARNGTRSKTVLTKAGPVQIDVPRDRDGSFEPKIVAKRQRRLGSIEDIVLSLSARGMTHGDISAHLADTYGSDCVEDDDLHDHRQGPRRDGRVAKPAAGPGLSGGVHRLYPRQGP